MNILRTATLVAIFIKCATASGGRTSQFREAVDQGDMDKAVQLCRSSGEDYDERDEMLSMFNYVVDTKDKEFIFGFAKQAKVKDYDLLVALHRKKSKKIVEEASKVFKF